MTWLGTKVLFTCLDLSVICDGSCLLHFADSRASRVTWIPVVDLNTLTERTQQNGLNFESTTTIASFHDLCTELLVFRFFPPNTISAVKRTISRCFVCIEQRINCGDVEFKMKKSCFMHASIRRTEINQNWHTLFSEIQGLCTRRCRSTEAQLNNRFYGLRHRIA